MIHKIIKDGIKEAMRTKDTLRLEVLRGLNALCQNEIIATGFNGEFLPDDKLLTIIKRSSKQRKDSIEQFDKGGRKDLADKERAELLILNSFLPTMMSRDEIRTFIEPRIKSLKSTEGDPKSNNLSSQSGKIIGTMIKELAGKADGAEVKSVVEELLKK